MRVEKTVFISYRRTNAPWALALYHALTPRGFDVFMDYMGLASGDFEQAILENVQARAHFIVVLTPSSLERCHETGDWFRREIETAIDSRRNIIPVMLDNFDFGAPAVSKQLTGQLASLEGYNGLTMPADYFDAALDKLCEKFLNIPLDAVSHPVSEKAKETAKNQQDAATAAPQVTTEELTAQHWFERGYSATDANEKMRFYTEAIRLDPDYANAYYNRGTSLEKKGNHDGAIADYTKAILINPKFKEAYYNRGNLLEEKGDYDVAIVDYNEAILLSPDDADAYLNRGLAYFNKGESDSAIVDYNEAIGLIPEYANAYFNRGTAHHENGDIAAAITDYKKYLNLGGGEDNDDVEAVEKLISDLQKLV